jgi:hypothetical protein
MWGLGFFWHGYCKDNAGDFMTTDMGHFGNSTDFGQTPAEIQTRFPAQLDARCGAAGRAGHHRPPDPDSPFRSRPTYALLSRVCLPGRKLSWVLAGLLFAASGPAQAATITARSPALADVSTAISSARDGDIVIIPAGTAAWASPLVITKGITLQGQTTTNSAVGTSVDSTVIQDSVSGAGATPVIQINSVAGKTYRITGITFAPGARTKTFPNGLIWLGGLSHSVRVDHCHFKPNHFQSEFIGLMGAVFGVADHNVMESSGSQSFNIRMGNWPNPDGSAGDGFGDGSWAAPTNFGSQGFFFIEDNYIKNVTGTTAFPNWNQGAGNLDGTFGGRFVFRHNHCYDTQVLNHGTFGGRQRGIRAIEIYNNDFHYTHPHAAAGCTGGTMVIHDNTWDGVQPKGIGLQCYRAFAGSPYWGGGSGDNPWDVNDTRDGAFTENGFSYNPVNGLYQSGTAASGTNHTTIVDPTKNWKPNQWVRFAVKRVANNTMAQVNSNTSNTLTVSYYPDGTSQANWAVGDQYQIRRPLTLLDQPGRGQGNVITGANAINTTDGKPMWPNNVLEPLYSWNNKHTPTGTSVNIMVNPNSIDLLQAGRDYYNNTPKSGYSPYVYPHPLVSGTLVSEIAPPTNLQIVP